MAKKKDANGPAKRAAKKFQVVPRKVKLTLVGLDGNAFVLMGAFSRQAKREGWPQADIDAVLDEAQTHDYDHLLAVLAAHCDGGGFGGDEEDE